jgi:hypothetical protein
MSAAVVDRSNTCNAQQYSSASISTFTNDGV